MRRRVAALQLSVRLKLRANCETAIYFEHPAVQLIPLTRPLITFITTAAPNTLIIPGWSKLAFEPRVLYVAIDLILLHDAWYANHPRDNEQFILHDKISVIAERELKIISL